MFCSSDVCFGEIKDFAQIFLWKKGATPDIFKIGNKEDVSFPSAGLANSAAPHRERTFPSCMKEQGLSETPEGQPLPRESCIFWFSVGDISE